MRKLGEDPDTDVADWLAAGARRTCGVRSSGPPGPFFPRVSTEHAIAIAESEVIAATLNHPSFYEAHGEDTSPAKQLVLEAVSQGFGQLFKTRADAERIVGPTKAAPLGNVRKFNKAGTGYKNRAILESNPANELVALEERVVLPRGIDHALDLAQLRAGDHEVWCLTFNFKDAF